jgi:hypothetical protein
MCFIEFPCLSLQFAVVSIQYSENFANNLLSLYLAQSFYSQNIILLYASFFCLPKRRSKKRAPDCTGPSGYLALLAVDGTLKTHHLRRLIQVQRHFPTTASMLCGTERV